MYSYCTYSKTIAHLGRHTKCITECKILHILEDTLTHLVYYAKNIKGIVQILEIWKKIAHIGRHT